MAMPAPSGSGAMLTCKVPVKRPLPCAVILIHGVNDDGHCFPTIDQELCNGLNERLGRDDLFPHQWGFAKDGDTTSSPLERQPMTVQKEGRSPVIPFHWGYRPVNKKTYDDEQNRYMADLQSHNQNPELPYSTYHIDRTKDQKAGWSNSDNFGNWLNSQFAKDGGTFSNATTNLVDMWGPGASGPIYSVTEPFTKSLAFVAGSDYSHPLHKNPHRIYLVHAAHRLADLILSIRGNKERKDDAINVIAHSQGTLITMLANFIVDAAGERPVDCVILCDSPYALDLSTMEKEGFAGPHQTHEARLQTLANFCQLINKNSNRVKESAMLGTGVAKPDIWCLPDHGRDNFGKVYNYFCPYDGAVSLYSVEGMGWQGVPDDALKAIGSAQGIKDDAKKMSDSNFKQRVFSEGAMVGDAPGKTFSMPGKSGKTSAHIYSNASFGGLKRTINADPLPQPFIFHLQSGQDHLGEHLGGTSLANEGGPEKLVRLVDTNTGVETALPWTGAPGNPYSVPPSDVQTLLQKAGYTKSILQAWAFSPSDSQYLITRYETKDEATARSEAKQVDWSQHSAIVENGTVARRCMVYDLAIGVNTSFADEKFWWNLLYRADWRHPNNPDLLGRKYYTDGILPDPIKRQMNYPNLPKGIVEQHDAARKSRAPTNPAAGDLTKVAGGVSTPTPSNQLWPLPAPDARS